MLLVLLAGCSSVHDSTLRATSHYYPVKEPIQCVPYARDASGINIYGDAHTWWNQAQGQYSQGRTPEPGAVMVLAQTRKMRHGHVAVVKEIIDSRHIAVEHSNWGYNRRTRSVVYTKMPVKDVSLDNDWSQVRFWDYPSKTYGRVYPVSGFIYRR
jgi:surface antigen